MKSLHYRFDKYRFFTLFLLFFFCSLPFVSGQSITHNNDDFYRKLITLKAGMDKEEVKAILGTPYKISFELNNNNDLTEDIYYKTEIKRGKWTLIVYQCVFKNSKLVALIQKEYYRETSGKSTVGPL